MFKWLCECSHKFGPVQSDGFQYCSKCGKANGLKPECSHEWQEIHATEIFDHCGRVKGYLYLLKCKKCGDMKEFKSTVP